MQLLSTSKHKVNNFCKSSLGRKVLDFFNVVFHIYINKGKYHVNYLQLVEYLQQNANPAYNQFNAKIVNSGVPTIGCTVPFLRKLSKSFTVSQVLQFPTHQFFEVDMIVAMVVSSAKLPFCQKQPLLWQLASTLENWAVCDGCIVKNVKQDVGYFQLFCQMARDGRPFVARYGIVNLLGNFLDDSHLDKVFEICLQVVAKGYYVDMAVAWLVATAMAKNPTKTKHFMQNQGKNLNDFCYNKALQKMRDSLRVSSQDKQWTRTMKK